jgi:hypothetical protein
MAKYVAWTKREDHGDTLIVIVSSHGGDGNLCFLFIYKMQKKCEND